MMVVRDLDSGYHLGPPCAVLIVRVRYRQCNALTGVKIGFQNCQQFC